MSGRRWISQEKWWQSKSSEPMRILLSRVSISTLPYIQTPEEEENGGMFKMIIEIKTPSCIRKIILEYFTEDEVMEDHFYLHKALGYGSKSLNDHYFDYFNL